MPTEAGAGRSAGTGRGLEDLDVGPARPGITGLHPEGQVVMADLGGSEVMNLHTGRGRGGHVGVQGGEGPGDVVGTARHDEPGCAERGFGSRADAFRAPAGYPDL